MPLNEVQQRFVEGVREGCTVPEQVFAKLGCAPQRSYRSDAFLEFLIALDATFRLKGERWHAIFVRGFIRHSELLDDGAIDAEELSHLELWLRRHGVGPYAVEMLVEVQHNASGTPTHWEDTLRDKFRMIYNGLRAVDAHGAFTLRRWIDMQKADVGLAKVDAELLVQINQRTLGTQSSNDFYQLYAAELGQFLKASPDHVEWFSRTRTAATTTEVTPGDTLLASRF